MRRGTVALLLFAFVSALGGCGDDSGEVTTEATDGAQVELVYAMGEGLSTAQAEQVKTILDARIDALGIEEATVAVGDGEVTITITPPPGTDAAEVSEILGDTAELRFRPVLLSLSDPEAMAGLPLTPPDGDQADAVVVLDGDPSDEPTRYQLGPTAVTGSIVESASAQLDPRGWWTVALVLTPEGIAAFNELAAECVPPSEACPTGQVAIVLDSIVRSAPTVQQPSFERDEIQISGSFTEDEAKALALVLRYGALPTSLTLQSTSP